MSHRPTVVRQSAVEHRSRVNRQVMRDVLPEWLSAPYAERFKLAARLLPLQTLLGNLALIAWMVFLALVLYGHITVS